REGAGNGGRRTSLPVRCDLARPIHGQGDGTRIVDGRSVLSAGERCAATGRRERGCAEILLIVSRAGNDERVIRNGASRLTREGNGASRAARGDRRGRIVQPGTQIGGDGRGTRA